MRRLAVLLIALLFTAAPAAAQVVGTFPGGSSGGAGTGDVTASGNPLIHQIAVWLSDTGLKGLGPCDTGTYLRGATGADPLCSTLLLPNAGTLYDIPLVTATNTWGYDTGKFTYNPSTGVLSAPAFAATDPTKSGQLTLGGLTSGAGIIKVPDVAGNPTVTLGSNTGTPAVTASAPLGITTATGNATCATCVTSTSPGAGIAHFAGSTQAVTSSAVVAADVATVLKARGIPFTIGDPKSGSAALTTSDVDFITVPFKCTISAYNLILQPSGTITVKFWKVATGTAAPTVTEVISTNGVGIASGTAIHSTTVTDFTTTAVAANDMMAMAVVSVATATYVQGVLQCDATD